ncbi:MAG: VWA domain-containing protein [Chloroflexota bacterium]
MTKIPSISQARQALYWRLLSTLFEQEEIGQNLEGISQDLAIQADLPPEILDPAISIEMLVHRFPKLQEAFERPLPGFGVGEDANHEPNDEEDVEESAELPSGPMSPNYQPETFEEHVEQTLVLSKILLNAFGPNTQGASVSAHQYAQWTKDIAWLEKMMGLPAGSLLEGRSKGAKRDSMPTGGGGEASRPPIGDVELKAGLETLEADMIQRMELREVLKDDSLARKLTPSMALVEQLLWDKGNLSGPALGNAKRLIQKYVEQLADVLKLQVRQVMSSKRDSSLPPKRIFRNIDMKRTIEKNLINYNPDDQKLYVDQIHYLATAKKSLPTTLLIIVDQSGSMTSSMVQTTILASIFAGLPNVEVFLYAFDNRVIDLSDYVHDPVEVLLRTKLGGGNDMRLALDAAAHCITSPQHTAVVVISDFYDWSDFFTVLKAWKESGCYLIPVGALKSSGYHSVNAEFTKRFKELGAPILNGSPKKLIEQIKKRL